MTVRQKSAERGWPDAPAAGNLARLREVNPLTHCVTNLVVTAFTANVLLAAGASPAMVIAAEEAGEFVAVADALLVNVGTVTEPDSRAMLLAARAAREARTPWVLDPVAVGAVRFRTGVVAQLVEHGPAIIRGNASEILALAGQSGGNKGVDSTARSLEAIDAAEVVADRTGAVVAVSGEVDYVVGPTTIVGVRGGDPLVTKVTGAGCALGALMAAFLAVAETPFEAAVAASAVFGAAGQRAAAEARGPGSLAVALVDQLHLLGSAPRPD
jgi:hydroxyethylthiazole kinase